MSVVAAALCLALLTTLCSSQGPLACSLCPQCTEVAAVAPFVPGDSCNTRRNALVLDSTLLCEDGRQVNVDFLVRDLRSIVNGAPSFNVLAFDSQAQLAAYRNCAASFRPFAWFPLQGPCLDRLYTGRLSIISSTNELTLVVECTSEQGCDISFALLAQCWLITSPADPAPVVGLILNALVLLAAIAFPFIMWWHSFPFHFDILVPLGLIFLTSVLNTVFFVMFMVDNITNNSTMLLSTQVEAVMFWLEKATLLFSALTVMVLLMQWCEAVHPQRLTRVRIIFAVSLVGIVALALGLVIPFGVFVNSSSDPFGINNALIRGFYGLLMVWHLVLCIMMILYGVVLLKSSSIAKSKSMSRLVFLLAILIVVAILRIIVFSVFLFEFTTKYEHRATQTPYLHAIQPGWVFFGYSFIAFGGGAVGANMFYILGIALPDAVPGFVLLVLLWGAVIPVATKVPELSLNVPLMNTNNLARYDV